MRRVDWRAAGALVLFGAGALALATDLGANSGASAQQAPTPAVIFTTSPGPAAPSALIVIPSSSPQPTLTPLPATPAPRGRQRGAPASPQPRQSAAPEATATPTSPAFSTLDGSWEVQVQRLDTTFYSRFAVTQAGSTVTGTWYVDGKQVPLDGTYDGRLFHFTAKDPRGALDLSGYVENATNMVGIVDNGKGEIFNVNPLAFTAEHRAGKGTFPKKGKQKG